MEYNTYTEWQTLGWQVKKGEKSHKQNNKGEAVFSEKQVIELVCPFCGFDDENCFCEYDLMFND